MSHATKNLWAGPTPNYELVTCACERDACERCALEPLPATIQAMFRYDYP
jgi:hypothetical protein